MKAEQRYTGKSSSFWAYARLISEKLKYSKNDMVISHKEGKILQVLKSLGLVIDSEMLSDVVGYLYFRAECLNNKVKDYLMDADVARSEFRKLLELHEQNGYFCKLPFNKQKGEKSDYAYFTCIINILTERTLREYCAKKNLVYGSDLSFDSDPLKLVYFSDDEMALNGIMSRRFDGMLPNEISPIAIWEIKEYYYTTTFGSRIADGVYETQLDGLEIKYVLGRAHCDVKHVFFVDAYDTWWAMGKSYLCRIIDMLHMGLVDEVIFGKEVFARWPQFINEEIIPKYELRKR